MQQLEKDFASVIPALEEAVPTTPGMWTSAVCAGFVAATLKPDELADLDAQLGALGLGNLRAKAAFAYRCCLWASKRHLLVKAWAKEHKADDVISGNVVQCLADFQAAHSNLVLWHQAHAGNSADVGRSQELFKALGRCRPLERRPPIQRLDRLYLGLGCNVAGTLLVHSLWVVGGAGAAAVVCAPPCRSRSPWTPSSHPVSNGAQPRSIAWSLP
jgi:hypothetical protein